ncbi:MAG: hypothetical protein US42_C0010G0035 [Candidatus Magasanikbacteria bacterium GW2011_GWC2_37_14]|uniref:DUF11 domain-containing protein n=1 Tax=Candidatus Magasanikbacteria bacterium GW2011_GWC2_37_14 TaxID=1619046 RepID=A0A0G0G8H5_9BACT|nr:MAG: hypothetical protein US42_C0010G0035 [Candidatus Magasanikbacteria bacterium GW2011_GWC2_37_14]
MTNRKFSRLSLNTEIEVIPKKVRKKVIKKEAVEPSLEISKLNRELKEIYKNGDGSMPNMGNFEKKPQKSFLRALFWLVFSCSFLAVVAWVGFFVLPGNAKFSEDDVVLEISGQEKVVAGSLVHYRINYHNAQNIVLNKTNLEVRYPAGFVFKEASVNPTNEQQDTWDLGNIQGGVSGFVDITGYLNGNFNDKQSLRAFLNYYPSNFNSEFQKVIVFNSEINSLPLEVNIEGPSEVAAGSEVELIINLSQPATPIKNLQLVLDSAGVFSYTTSSISPNPKIKNTWDLPEIVEALQIKIKGSFNSNGEDASKIKFKLISWPDEKRTGEGFVWLEKEIAYKILKNELAVSLAINGATQDFSLSPENDLNVSLVLKNIGSLTLKNLQPRLFFEAPSFNNKSILDWSNLTDIADGEVTGEQVNDNTRKGVIAWSSKNIGILTSLASNKEVRIDISLPFKTGKNVDLSQFTSYLASVWGEVKYNVDEEKVLSTGIIKMVINSDLSFESRKEEIKNSTNKDYYKISWILNNSFHDLKDVEISGNWYGDLLWQDDKLVVPAGEVNYDKEKKNLVWKIKTLPKDLDVVALQFAFVLNTLNPSQTDLSSKITIKATDAVTGEEIVKVVEGFKLN